MSKDIQHNHSVALRQNGQVFAQCSCGWAGPDADGSERALQHWDAHTEPHRVALLKASR